MDASIIQHNLLRQRLTKLSLRLKSSRNRRPSNPSSRARTAPESATVTKEDLQQLLHALHIQAKVGIVAAREKPEKIMLIMLT